MDFIRTLIAGCLLLMAMEVFADGELAYPLDDAKSSFNDGLSEFVGIELKDEILIPGLSAEQQDVAVTRYKVRILNKRWKTFKNIEERPKDMKRMGQYATLYNLMLWKLVNGPKPDQFKYRY